jgi:tetratricopeptide (TPR) repeat protein
MSRSRLRLLPALAGIALMAQEAGEFERGMALARQGRLEEARAAFEAGQRDAPRDQRFPRELAGIAFKQNRPGDAKRLLRRTLRLDPRDAYALDFLGSLYLLEDNPAAALTYWNRADKPHLAAVTIAPPLETDPVLVDRALAFAPGAILRRQEYWTTQRLLRQMNIFSSSRMTLAPQSGEDFQMEIAALERNGWGGSAPQALASLLRGVGFQTVFPAYYNHRRRAIHFESLLRWDPRKQRLQLQASGPLAGGARLRGIAALDARREQWDLSETWRGQGRAPDRLPFRRLAAEAGFAAVVSSRMTVRTGAGLSWRGFSGASAAPAFVSGFAPSMRLGADLDLLRLPERRLTLQGSSELEAGRLLAGESSPYVRIQSEAALRWYPQARGDDYAVSASLHAGAIGGDAPFDALFQLGIERDNPLWFRGAAGTARGRKGAAPLGRRYLLFNWEADKHIARGSFWSLTAGPLFDAGAIADPRGVFGSGHWLAATGLQAKVKIPAGSALVFTWGKDLQTGRNTFYASLER